MFVPIDTGVSEEMSRTKTDSEQKEGVKKGGGREKKEGREEHEGGEGGGEGGEDREDTKNTESACRGMSQARLFSFSRPFPESGLAKLRDLPALGGREQSDSFSPAIDCPIISASFVNRGEPFKCK